MREKNVVSCFQYIVSLIYKSYILDIQKRRNICAFEAQNSGFISLYMAIISLFAEETTELFSLMYQSED